jgi:hypothetical protein
MEVVVITISLLAFFAIGFVASFQGLDLRKWSSWVYGGIGFLCGLATGFLLSGNLLEGLKAGAAFAALILVGGATMRWHKQRYGSMARSLLTRYGRSDRQSLFAKLVIRLLNKHK